LVLRLGCEGVECAASAAVGRVRLVLGSAAEEEEDDAALVDGCAVAAAGGGGGGLGLAAAFMAEDFFWFWLGYGLDLLEKGGLRAGIGEERGGRGLWRDVQFFFFFRWCCMYTAVVR
jgi:hypothetical protein